MAEATDAPEVEKDDDLSPLEQEMAALGAKVEAELAELEPRYQRLLTMRDRLNGTTTVTPVAAPKRQTTTPRPRATTSSGEGTRLEQFMAAVRAQPGLKVPEYAKIVGIKPNYIYRVRGQALAAEPPLIRVEDQAIFPQPVAA